MCYTPRPSSKPATIASATTAPTLDIRGERISPDIRKDVRRPSETTAFVPIQSTTKIANRNPVTGNVHCPTCCFVILRILPIFTNFFSGLNGGGHRMKICVRGVKSRKQRQFFFFISLNALFFSLDDGRCAEETVDAVRRPTQHEKHAAIAADRHLLVGFSSAPLKAIVFPFFSPAASQVIVYISILFVCSVNRRMSASEREKKRKEKKRRKKHEIIL